MRRVDLDLTDVGFGHFKNKFTGNVVVQMGRLLEYFGWSFVALMFFVGAAARFPKDARRQRCAGWSCACGSARFSACRSMALSEELGFAANQLHLLFIPIMTCYGLAYLLVQWNRLEIEYRLARIGFLTLLFLVCAVPDRLHLPHADHAHDSLAALCAALHFHSECVDEAERDHRVRHAVGGRVVCRSQIALGAGHAARLHRVQRLQHLRFSGERPLPHADQRQPEQALAIF